MRIQVTGTCPAASGLRGLLQQHDFQLVESHPTFHIEVEEAVGVERPIVDGVDSEFERRVVAHLTALVGSALIQRAGGVQREDQIKITIEAQEEPRWHLQRAVFRALSEIRKDDRKKERTWYGTKRR